VKMAATVWNGLLSFLFEYNTPKIVHIRSKQVGLINRLLQLTIIGYIIGFAIVYKKGYQENNAVTGAVTTKVKGVAKTYNLTGNSKKIWDVTDYVVPPQENNAVFVITNLIITMNQQQGECEEDNSIPGANCTLSNICEAGEPLMAGDGYMTGKCNDSKRYPGERSCVVEAWCPTEDETKKPPERPALKMAENFTIFIKNNIEFPKFGVKRRNIFGLLNEDELRNCRFDKDDSKNRFCPIFHIRDILQYAGVSNFSEIGVKGGVIQIIIHWDCNLDHHEDECVPEYSFRRLDSDADELSKGYNFRYAHYFNDKNGTETRTLYKAYGIKFIVTLQGKAGKFGIVPLILDIASGLALLTLASIVSDIVVLYVVKARTVYRENKYHNVVGADAYKGYMGTEIDESHLDASVGV